MSSLICLLSLSLIGTLSPLDGMERKINPSSKGSITFKTVDKVPTLPTAITSYTITFGDKQIQGLDLVSELFRPKNRRLTLPAQTNRIPATPPRLRKKPVKRKPEDYPLPTTRKQPKRSTQEKNTRAHLLTCPGCAHCASQQFRQETRKKIMKETALINEAMEQLAGQNMIDKRNQEQDEPLSSSYVYSSSDISSPLISEESLESIESLSSNDSIE